MLLCFMYCLTLFYFWAVRSHDRQVEINTYLLIYLHAFEVYQQRVTHPFTNRARRRKATTLTQTNVLPLSQTATKTKKQLLYTALCRF